EHRIDTIELDKEAAQRVHTQVRPEEHAVAWVARLPGEAPATAATTYDAARQPHQEAEDHQIHHQLVADSQVHGHPDLSERVWIRATEGEREAIRVGAVMLAVDDVADPADRHAEYERRRGHVGQPRDIQPLAPGVQRADHRPPDDRAVDG